MVLEALVRGSTIASCSVKVSAPCRSSIRSSEPRCSFFSPRTAKVLKGRCCLVTSKAAYRSPECNQAIVSLPKQKAPINPINVDSYQTSSFSEHWIEDCICEVVKHINEAPFLQLLFDSKDNCLTVTSQRQRLPAGDSPNADEKWKDMKIHVSTASPDGVILVQHLHEKQSRDASNECIESRNNGKDLWGILVLGKAIAKSACYILETTSVASPFGTCTCFCLTKAQSFGSSWRDQIQSSWLLETDN